MEFYIIIGIILSVFAWLVLSSVKLRLLYDEPIRRIDISYTVIKFRIDLKDFYGKLYLIGIRIHKFNLRELGKKEKKATKETKPKIKKKEKKAFWKSVAGFDRSLVSYKNLGILRNFIGKIRISYLNVEIKGGFNDPYRTGQAVASYWAAMGMFRRLMSHINFYPDFEADSLEIKGKGVVSLRVIYILVLVIRILTIFVKWKIMNKDNVKKKGLAYV